MPVRRRALRHREQHLGVRHRLAVGRERGVQLLRECRRLERLVEEDVLVQERQPHGVEALARDERQQVVDRLVVEPLRARRHALRAPPGDAFDPERLARRHEPAVDRCQL